MVFYVYSLESSHWKRFKCKHTTYLLVKENQKDKLVMPPDFALWLTLISSNYLCLKHIFMVPKVFEPLKIYIWLKRQRCRVRYLVWPHTFVSPSADSRKIVVSYWWKYVHKVLVNHLVGLSLPRKSVIRLTDRPDITIVFLLWSLNSNTTTTKLYGLCCCLNIFYLFRYDWSPMWRYATSDRPCYSPRVPVYQRFWLSSWQLLPPTVWQMLPGRYS